jgi:YggT family protein
LIRVLIDLYIFLLVVDIILSYLPQYRHHVAVTNIRRLADFTCAPVRRWLPKDLPFDFSPLIVITLLKLLELLW